ncbi:H/ACA ribonucleoprotein complex subunit 2-like protein [Coccinella septempunctata]|uniref:H/ACA ribonucleoprotein complex subunit 2-like protein n=1 Tax=Coccinella septempunctata TaxID=41139 RepID=UPI001D08A44F|nr:H/ACA ribonucleoprotein complex subunit 2-like protein [Coccinella septempunctata]
MTKSEEVADESMVQGDELTYEEKIANCSIIAKPMASKKLSKRCYKLIKKAALQKSHLRCGLKDVQSRIRKGEKGIVVFAGDVTPIEIMCHLPIVCEEREIPYIFTPSRKDLGASMGVKRGCLMVLIRPHPEYQESYDELYQEIKSLPITI